jgi:hypothetical protein
MQIVAQKNIIEKLTPEAQNAVKTLSEIIQPLLDEIHKKPPTTQNYYGDYMLILSEKPLIKRLLITAMIYSGCNREGLSAAIKLT